MKRIHKWKKSDIGWIISFDELCMHPMMPDETHVLELNEDDWERFPSVGPIEEWTITHNGELFIVYPD